MRILLLTPSLSYGGAAGQLVVLAPRLAAHGVEARLAVLDGESPWCRRLRDAGVPVELLGWRRLIDPKPFLSLRRLMRTLRPDVVHTSGVHALRAAAVVSPPGRVLAGDALSGLDPRRVRPLDAWLLRRAGRVLASGDREARRIQSLGVAAERVVVVPLAADVDRPKEMNGACDLPTDARVILCVGPLSRGKGHREAIWAFDILKYLYDDLHLVLVGAGPEREKLEEFARAIGAADRVRFIGSQPDLRGWLARAALVWVPSVRPGGRGATLDAMAAGCCVVATRVPGSGDVIVDGVSGMLVPPGDKAALARQTHKVLEDDCLRRRLGDAARTAARSDFSPDLAAARLAEVYRSVGS